MTTTSQLLAAERTATDRLNHVENFLRQLVDDYYQGACIYRQLPADDSALRIFWRIRLGVLARIGSDLADALGLAEPDWEALTELADQNRPRHQHHGREPDSDPLRNEVSDDCSVI